MRKTLFALLAAGVTLVACQKEADLNRESLGEKVTITLTAAHDEQTKTTLSGTSAFWTSEDKVTVMYKQDGKSGWFTAKSAAATSSDSYATATFTADLTTPDAGESAYAIYPANNLTQDVADKAKITIASTQHPTATSFDGGSDIMISKPFTPSTDPITTQFARANAVLKIKINNATISSQKIVSLAVTGENPLAGDVLVGLSDKTVKGIENGSNTVAAEYASANQFTVGAEGKYIYLIVSPQTLASGSKLNIFGVTTDYEFSKEITLSQNIYLNAGHIMPLNITIPDSGLLMKGVQHTFATSSTNKFTAWDTGLALNEMTWTLAKTNGSASAGMGNYDTRGQQIGTADNGITTVTLTGTNYASVTGNSSIKKGVKWIAVTAGAKNGRTITSSVSVGGVAMSPLSSGSDSYKAANGVAGTMTFVSSRLLSGDIVITYTLDEQAALYIKEVNINSDLRTDPALAFATASKTAYLGDPSYEKPALTNTHSVAVNYDSSNKAVATVDSNGDVTLLSAGETTISASFEGNATYQDDEASYILTVSTPTISAATLSEGDILIGGSANNIKEITITATHAWTASLNSDATSARGTDFAILNSSDEVIDGIVSGSAGATTIKFKALNDGNADGSTVNNYGTITFTDNYYGTANTGAIYIKQSPKGGLTTLNTPRDVSISAITKSSFTASWTSTYSDFTWYFSTKSTASAAEADYVKTGTTTSKTVTVSSDLTLTEGTTYYFYVKANGDNTETADSEYGTANKSVPIVISWSRSSTTDTSTDGYTFSAEAEGKTGYYQDGSGSKRYVQLMKTDTSTPIFNSTPTSISFTAKLGGGNAKDPLTNKVYVVLLDSSGSEISSTVTEVTDKITSKEGSDFTVSITAPTSAYGVRLYHNKETSYNVRYYNMTLTVTK